MSEHENIDNVEDNETEAKILLNADMGERGIESEEDHRLMPLLDLANLACGGHAGDRESVAFFSDMALQQGVKVSAHLSYADRPSFGRQVLDISLEQLCRDLDQQRALLPDATMLKFHGALYNQTCSDRALAEAMVNWLEAAGFKQVVTLPDSHFAHSLQDRGIEVKEEVFAERRYLLTDHGRAMLMPRTYPSACITELVDAIEQVDQMLSGDGVVAYSDEHLSSYQMVTLPMQTVCVHSDSIIAYPLARAIRSLLTPI